MLKSLVRIWFYIALACTTSLVYAWPTNDTPPTTPVLTGPSLVDTNTDFQISWTTSSTHYTTVYYIDESTNGTSWTEILTLPMATSTTISGKSAGTYYYRARAENIYGTSGLSGAKSVQVIPPPPPTASINWSPSQVCKGSQSTLTRVSQHATSCKMYSKGSSNINDSPPPTSSFVNSALNHVASYTINSDSKTWFYCTGPGGTTPIDDTFVDTRQSPVISQGDSYDISVNEGESVTFTLTASDPDGGTINWTKETNPAHGTVTGLPAPGNSVNITYNSQSGSTSDTSFIVKANGDDNACLDDTITINVSIISNNKPIADAGPNRSVTEGDTVTLDGSGSYDPDGDSITYAWTPSTYLNSSTSSTPIFTAPSVTSTTVYTLNLVVTDEHGEPSTSDSVNVTVSNAPVPERPDSVSFSGSSNKIINYNSSVDIQINWTDSDTSHVAYYKVQRKKNGGNYADIGTTTAFYDSSNEKDGDYYFQVASCNSDNQCSTYRETSLIKVREKPQKPNAPQPNTTSQAPNVTYEVSWQTTSNKAGSNLTYELFQNGVSPRTVTNANNAENYSNLEGVYTYHLDACNEFACSDSSASDAVTVEVILPPSLTAEYTMGETEITLNWIADPTSSDPNNYEFEYKKSSDIEWSLNEDMGATLTKTIEPVYTGAYQFRVRACLDLNCSNWPTPFEQSVIGKTTYKYDALGRLHKVIDGTGKTVIYNYDAAGNRTSVVIEESGS